jgi:BolA protein
MTDIEDRMREQLAALEPTQIEIADDSHLHAGHAGAQGGGRHYRLSIVSAQFIGKNTLARHRMIYSALHELMQHDIHALNIKAIAPDELQP